MSRIIKSPGVRRLEIVKAAREMFLEKDYDNTTMNDLMNTLAIAKGTIYHYFKSKEDLLEAVVQDMVQDYVVSLQSAMSKANRDAHESVNQNALERMKTLITAGQVSETQKETLAKLHRPGNTALHTRLLAVTISKLAALYADVFEQGNKEGIFQVAHPLETAEFLIAGIQFITDEGCYPWSQRDLDRRDRSIPSLIESLLKAPKGSFDFLINREMSEKNTLQ